jgi:diguanylate cyclase (GGDEF)-like protein/PAS domain S-box-containing protein
MRKARANLGSWLVVACVLLTLAFWGVLGANMLSARHQVFAAAEQTAANLKTALLQEVDRTFELYDLSLKSAITGLQLPGFDAMPPDLQHAILFDGSATAKYLDGIGVVGADGQVRITSGINGPIGADVSDREFFAVQRDNAGLGLHVSLPFVRRHGGAMEIALSRRINGPDGRFEGVVFGLINIDYFRELFENLTLGPHDVIALYRGDIALLMRRPFDPARLGQMPRVPPPVSSQKPSVTFEQVSVVDGVRRLYSLQHGSNVGVIITVGLAESEIYRLWWRRAAVLVPIMLVLGVVAIALALLVDREMRQRRQAMRRARESEAMYRMLADKSGDMIVRTDLDGVRRYLSPAVSEILGWQPDELVGTAMGDLIHPDDAGLLRQLLRDLRAGLETALLTYRVRCKDGRYVWIEAQIRLVRDAAGQPEAFISNMREITRRKQHEEDLEQAKRHLEVLATTDPLTGLANRRRLDEALEREWLRARRDRRPIALMLIDADHFKLYNDCYGHPQGDSVLQTIAGCIEASVRRPGDLAARYGGEEFAVLLPNTTASQAMHVAENIRRTLLVQAVPHAGNPAGIATVSIGVAASDAAPTLTPTVLLRDADAALYAAKQQGRNCVRRAAERVGAAAD